jgi:2-amino-4-hydroxy-6-hydroxymethyldihydropteridine diphosphokinase
MPEIIAYIGLCSNLADPLQQVQTALRELAAIPETRVIAQSSLYQNPPMGPQDQPDYINAVAGLVTTLNPEALLDALQAIEQLHQRERLIRWGARTLDLDMLLYGQELISTERLEVPHTGLKQRIFVVQPLLEIAPELILPDGTELAKLMQQFEALLEPL